MAGGRSFGGGHRSNSFAWWSTAPAASADPCHAPGGNRGRRVRGGRDRRELARSGRAPRGRGLRARLGARRLPRDVRAPGLGLARAHDAAQVHRRVHRRRRYVDPDQARDRQRRESARQHDPGPGACDHATVRRSARDARGPGGGQRVDGQRTVLQGAAVPRDAAGRAASPASRSRAPGSAAGKRRHAAGRGAGPDLTDSRRRRPDRRHGRLDPGRRGHGLRRSGLPAGREGRPRRHGADLPEAACGHAGGRV